MTKYDYDLVVIGGGAAGLTTASGAAQLGARTLLLEKDEALGGDCLHFGCVPSKSLIRTAAVYHQMKNSKRYGLPPVSPPPVDYTEVAKRIQRVIDVIQKHDSVERFNRLGAEVRFGSSEFVDEHTLRFAEREITARKILLATGSRAAVPAIDGLEEAGYITNREIFKLTKLPESMVIVGAGAIAIEMAQAFSRLGTEVSVIQRSEQILSKEDKDMADMVMQALQEEGVTFHLQCQIKKVNGTPEGKTVVVQQGDREKSIKGEKILIALGRQANVEHLGLDGIDIDYNNKGIQVDNRLRTSRQHIFAAGDVNGGYQFTHAAGYEGGIVVSNAIFNLPRRANYTWMPWCTYTSPELASIGMNEKRAKKEGIEYSVWKEDFSASDRALAEEEARGSLKLLLDKKGKPLGVQILGPHGGELLSEWVAVLNGKVKLSTLAGAVHPYPTLGEINKKVTGSIFAEKIFSEKTRNLLQLIFRYQGSSV
ncbi:MAG: FAD-dependent oxidoreductase [Desulfocapsaceae bacterium]|nr:FAD-dependent oxidoreductase [Desulfocapsaceae bacterium]